MAASRSSSRRTARSSRTPSTSPALRDILTGVQRREIAVHSVETATASPFASSLLFDYVAAYMYDGDAPLAERRAQALTLDRDLLRELLGQEELRELLDADALADLELSLQALADDRRATTLDQVHDLLRRLGDLSTDELAARTEGGSTTAEPWLRELKAARRVVEVRIAGVDRWIAVEDVARYRDGVGVATPVGVPQAFLAPAVNALDGLLARWARTHGPFLGAEPARRWGLPPGVVEDALDRLVRGGTLLRGEFRPGGAEREWCDPDVLRLLRRRSLAKLRREVEPVDPVALARFLPSWHGIAPVNEPPPPALRGAAALERLAEVVDQVAGLPIPASVLERDILPARIPGYQPRLLDELGAMGEVAWVGRGSLGRDDGRIVLVRPGRETLGRWASPTAPTDPTRNVTSASGSTSADAGRASTGSCSPPPAAGRIGKCSMRCGTSCGPARSPTTPSPRCAHCAGSGRRVTGARDRAGSRASARPRLPGAGRCVDPGWGSDGAEAPAGTTRAAAGLAAETERRHATALALLERYGVLVREAVNAEGVDGGFSAVYPVLRAMEERAGSGAATWSMAWAAPSSRCPEPSIACAPCASPSR